MKQMSRRDRIQAAIRREPVDRIPYAFWRHFPDVDRNPAGLAQATLRFHDRYGSDFLKITPSGGYAVEAWGCVEGTELRPDGHRPCGRCAVRDSDDWRRIRPLDPGTAPGYQQQLEVIIRMGFDRRIGDAPVVPTLFSPLSIARKLSGDRLSTDLRERPALVKDALEAITETQVRFAELTLAEGMSGIFYSIQAASHAVHPEGVYAEFGEPYDRQVLEAIASRSSLTIIHCHGRDLMFDRLARLPGHVWNWSDRTTPPTLEDALTVVPGAVAGGLDEVETLPHGGPDRALEEVDDARARTGGIGLIVAAGCVLPIGTPDPTVAAVVRALGGPLKPIPGVAV